MSFFCIWEPDLPDKVLFEQSSEASERANHMDILQKLNLGREYKCKDLLEAEGGGHSVFESRKEASEARLE